MKTLVVIPSLMHKWSFSAPLAWLFGHDADKVRGCYSVHLTKELVRAHESFIVQLNWFIELCEFELIVRFIRRHNPRARILFGGLHSQLTYRDVFANNEVDFFIKGDNEVPLREYLNGTDARRIPNLVGRDFENPLSYRFRPEEFETLKFDLDWIPDYFPGWESFPEPDSDEETCFDELPRYPQYWEPPNPKVPLSLRWRVAPKGGRYHLPMLITGRGGCPAAHDGCEYCLGSKHERLRAIYGRSPITMSNAALVSLLDQINQKYPRVCLYINSDCTYDLSGHQYDLEATIEIDSRSTAADAARLLGAFRKAKLHVGLFEEGITGGSSRSDVEDYLALEDANHRVYFFANPEDLANLAIPPERRLYTELVLPPWAHWDFYTDPKKAARRSRQWYAVTGQMNLYPFPRRIIAPLIRRAVITALWGMNKAGWIDVKRRLI